VRGAPPREMTSLVRGLTAKDAKPLICGPFLGEPGYETLYWVPFLRRCVRPVLDRGHDVIVVSRGGVESLYSDLLGAGARYLDVLDILSPEDFLAMERERLQDPLRKNQKLQSAFEQRILDEAGLTDARPLLPLHMFSFLARYEAELVCDWDTWPQRSVAIEREDVTLVKFWFGGQLPATHDNVRGLEALLERLAVNEKLVAISNPYSLELHRGFDDPFDDLVGRVGLRRRATTSARNNLGEQAAMLSKSTRMVSTYGGLAYLSLYADTPARTFYTDPRIVFTRHFRNFSHALERHNSVSPNGDLRISLTHLADS